MGKQDDPQKAKHRMWGTLLCWLYELGFHGSDYKLIEHGDAYEYQEDGEIKVRLIKEWHITELTLKGGRIHYRWDEAMVELKRLIQERERQIAELKGWLKLHGGFR